MTTMRTARVIRQSSSQADETCSVSPAALWSFCGAALLAVLAVYSGQVQGGAATLLLLVVMGGGIGVLRACGRKA